MSPDVPDSLARVDTNGSMVTCAMSQTWSVTEVNNEQYVRRRIHGSFRTPEAGHTGRAATPRQGLNVD
jgi:hypothetical protein